MKIHLGLENFLKGKKGEARVDVVGKPRYCLTFGKFEAFHMGHECIIRMLLHKAKRENTKSLVLSFLPPQKGLAWLLARQQRFQDLAENKLSASISGLHALSGRVSPRKNIEAIFRAFGVDDLLYLDWELTKSISYVDFLDTLAKKITMVSLVASEKLAIGCDRKGSPQKIAEYFQKNFSREKRSELCFFPSILLRQITATKQINAVHDFFQAGKKTSALKEEGIAKKQGKSPKIFSKSEYLSSTCLRILLLAGRVQLIHKLGYLPFSVRGRVKMGKQIGRTLGYPTANINFPSEASFLRPASYCSVTVFKKNLYASMSFVGYSPAPAPASLGPLEPRRPSSKGYGYGYGRGIQRKLTVNSPILSIETHIFDIDEVLYKHDIEVFFIDYIRENVKFKSQAELLRCLKKDEAQAKTYFYDMPGHKLGSVIDRIKYIRKLRCSAALLPNMSFMGF